MVATRQRLMMVVILVLLLQLACYLPREGTPTVSGPELIRTYAALTVQARLTLQATGVQPTFTPPGGTPIPPPASTATPAGEATLPGPTATSSVCDRADFIKDISYPDDTTVTPGAEFIKTWQLQNTGTCTWNSSYVIFLDDGDALGAAPSVTLTTGVVAPGEKVDVSVSLKAPEEEGSYQGYWKLRNPAGQEFGVGSAGDKQFWVKIRVKSQLADSYDFVAQASAASWVASGGGGEVHLTFGGEEDDPDGVAKLKGDFVLENGAEAGKTLVVHPRHTADGEIAGAFSEYTVQDGNRFKAKLGFLEDCGSGQVIYQLWVKQGDSLNLLQEWEKSCTGKLLNVDVDLAGLKGKKVQFVLVVLADGSPADDLAIWGSARIVR